MAVPIPAQLQWACMPPSGAPHWTLLVKKGGEVLDAIPLSTQPLTILGRNRAMSHVALDHASISRQHAALAFDASGELSLVDMGSSHGTFVGDARLAAWQKQPLPPASGLDFRLGASTRTFSVVTAASAAAELDKRTMPPPPSFPLATAPQPAISAPPAPGSAACVLKAGIESVTAADGDALQSPAAFALARAQAAATASEHAAAETHSAAGGPSSAAAHAAASVDAAAARAARDAELAAIMESMRKPVQYTPSTSAATVAATSSRVHGLPLHDGAEDDEDDEEEEEEKEDVAAAAAAAGLPLAFGRQVVQRAPTRPPPTTILSSDPLGAHARNGGMHSAAEGDASPRHSARDGDDAHAAAASGDMGDGTPATTSAAAHSAGAGAGAASAALAADLGLPITHEAVLGGHAKSVTAIAFDVAGGRLVTGSTDMSVRMFDFGGMDRSHRSFRDWSPLEGHSITCLQFSPSGDRFGLATPAARFQVYDREGKKLVTTIKGDQYLADMAHTKGHVAAVTGLAWHPTAPDFIISASEDGTMRFWNLNGRKIFDELLCGDIIKVKNSRGLKACVTCMLLTPDGRALIAGVDDGSLQMFNLRAPGAKYIRPDVHIAAAHAPGSRIVSLSCDAAGTRLVSRSDDGVVKLWDARKPGKTPLATVQGADNHALVTNAVFSPDARLLLVPTARMPGPHASSGAAVGRVLVFRVPDLEAACQSAAAVGSSSAVDAAAAPFAISLPPGVTPTVVVWHAVINQVAVGCSDGATRILFDPVLSKKGAILSSGRAPKAREAIDEVLQGKVGRIIVPNALPLFREDDERAGRKRRRVDRDADAARAAAHALATHTPATIPPDEPDFLHVHAKTYTQHYVATHNKMVNLRAQDPAEVLRSYAERAQTEMPAIAAAYAATAPKRVLADVTLEAEEESIQAATEAYLHGNVAGK